MKKITAFLLSLVFSVVFAVSCGGTAGPSGGGNGGDEKQTVTGNGEIDFWSASTAETVLLDKPAENYSSVRREAKIDVLAAKNEYEGAQIFLTAEKTVTAYDVTVGELKTAAGDAFPKENVEVYAYKYITVSNNVASHRRFGVGLYPDAIMPFDTIKKFGENKIEKGNNQGIYIRFHTPKDQKAGVYTGKATVSYDGKSKDIPVTLEVADVTVSEENHLQTLFLVGWLWQQGEQTVREEKYYDYVKLLSEYRLSPYFLMTKDSADVASPDYWDRYAEVVYNYVKDPVNSCYALNFIDMTSSFDVEKFETMLLKLAEKSCEKQLNVLTKAVAHFNSLIDEVASQPYKKDTYLPLTKRVTDDFRAVRISAAEKIRANAAKYAQKYGVSEQFVEEIAVTTENIPHIFVSNYDADYAPYIEDDGTGTGEWCPNVWEFQQPNNVSKYIDDLKIDWWYGCGGFARDIPNYCTDDYTLSPRIMSWQQMYYGITGNLYWGVDMYGNWEAPEDFYDQNASVGGSNGDGWLAYPGAPYELDMPVATRRLEAIRDGMEEYELLLALKNRYGEISERNGLENSFDDAFAFLSDKLFTGIDIVSTAEDFESSRELLMRMLTLANSEAEVCVREMKATDTDVRGEIYVKKGYGLTVGGTALTERAVGEGKAYSFNLALNDYHNEFAFKVSGVTGNNEMKIVSEGKAIFYAPSESMLAEVKNGYAEATKTLVFAADAGITSDSEKLIKIDVAATVDSLQSFNLSSSVIEKLSANTSAIKILIYNGSGRSRDLSLEAKYSGDPIIAQLAVVWLKEGWNEITLSGLSGKNWSKLGKISYLQFVLGNTENEPAVNGLYLGGYYVTYLKGENA